MKLAIILDTFSGHLFHDIELYIVLFEKTWRSSNNKIFFIDLGSKNKFKDERISKINHYLCNKLFNSDEYKIVKNYKSEDYDIVIDRKKLNHRKLNKAFAASISKFPYISWSERFVSLPNKTFKILYVSRQKTTRKLTFKSHNFIVNMIRKYRGTVCEDLGIYSLEEQIKIFRNHTCVIGVHGNNLTGVMWMNPNSHVFEILPYKEKDKVYDYHCLSLCMRHHYTQINCQGSIRGNIDLTSESKDFLTLSINMLKRIYKFM